MNNINLETQFINLLKVCNLSKRNFCKLININESNFIRLTKCKSVPNDILYKIDELGVNLRWFFTGNGEIFLNNPQGKFMKDLYDSKKYDENDIHIFRLNVWISTHYNSYEEFLELFNISDYITFRKMRVNSQIPLNITATLVKEGLNVRWLYNKNESPYLKNEKGNEKKDWLVKNCSPTNMIYLELKGMI